MKRRLALILMLMLILGTLSGCGQSQEKPAEAKGHESAVVIDSSEWEGTDGYQAFGGGFTTRFQQDSLIAVLEDGTYGPEICESFSVAEDGSSISFVIPTDFKFADGTELTPQDVKRSLEWGLEISPFNEDYANITEIKIDGQTVTCMLSSWNPAALYSMAGVFVPILPAKQIDSMSQEELLWGATPYGAYYVEEYVEGSHVTLKANPYYKTNNPEWENKGPATVETLTVRFISDAFAVSNTLESGEACYYVTENPIGIEELKEKNEKIATQERPANSTTRLLVNSSKEILADSKVREAIARAIDREAICNHEEILAEPSWLYNSPTSLDYAEEAAEYNKENYGYDKEKALELLAEAGWTDTDGDGILDKDGKKFHITLGRYEEDPLSTLLQIQLQDIGIEAEIVTGEQTDEDIDNDTYDLHIAGWGWGDTAGTLPYIYYDADNPGCDTEAYLDLVAQGIQETDSAERVKLFGEAQKTVIDSFTMIPLISYNYLVIYNTDYLDENSFYAEGVAIANGLK